MSEKEAFSRITSHKIIDGSLYYRIQCKDNSYRWASAESLIVHSNSVIRYFYSEDHELKDQETQTEPTQNNSQIFNTKEKQLTDLFSDYKEQYDQFSFRKHNIAIDGISLSPNAQESVASFHIQGEKVSRWAALSALRISNPRDLATYLCTMASKKH